MVFSGGGSMEPPLCTNGSAGYLMQLSVKTLDKWNMEIDKGNYTGAVFVDFSKAFDIVNHKSLIDNLNSFVIAGIKNKRVKSYLDNHTHCVSINGTISTLKVSCLEFLKGQYLDLSYYFCL